MHESSERSDDDRWRDALAPFREGGGSPPADLEDRLARAVGKRRAQSRLRPALAAILLLVVGGLAGRWWASSSHARSTEPRFLLLLYQGPAFDTLSSTHESRVTEYDSWARDLARRGRLVDAGELAPGEQRLGKVTDAQGDIIDGMFIVTAKDEAEAMAIAGTCPHLKHGGGVSVRLIRSS